MSQARFSGCRSPAIPRNPTRAIDPESYRLMLEGWHQLLDLRNDKPATRDLFQRSTEIDPLNARAWAGLSSVWAVEAISGVVPFDVGYDRASAAAARALALDSLQSSAWGNLAILRALSYRSLAIGMELMQKAIAAEPGNPEIFLIKSTLIPARASVGQGERRDSCRTSSGSAVVRVCRERSVQRAVRRPARGCAATVPGRGGVEPDEQNRCFVRSFATGAGTTRLERALARLGRYDDAIATWRKRADAKNPQLTEALSRAHGESGYWAAKHIEGRAALVAVEKEEAQGWVAPMRALQAHFLGGDIDGGFRVLESAMRDKDPRLYHLPCAPGVDEVRQSPRFKAILERVGALPER